MLLTIEMFSLQQPHKTRCMIFFHYFIVYNTIRWECRDHQSQYLCFSLFFESWDKSKVSPGCCEYSNSRTSSFVRKF